MLITGYTYRSLPEREVCSFDLSFAVSSVNGCSKFAFSGTSDEWVWNFQSGRVIDPNNKFIGGYSTDEIFNISGNISGGYFNYTYNGDFTAQSTRTNFPIKAFYLDSSSCELTANVNIMAPAQPYSFSFPTSYTTGSSFTIGFINGDTGRSFKVFSGQLYQSGSPSSCFLFRGSQFPISVQTGTNIIINDTGSSEGVTYPLDFKLWTSFGVVGSSFSIVDNVSNYNAVFEVTNFNNTGYANFDSINSNAQSLISSGVQDTVNYGNWSVYYAINNSGQSKNLRISLDAISGHTGNFLAPFVSGILFTHSGNGYSSAPTVSFSGGGGAGAAATVTLLGGYINSFTMTSFGSGYTSPPTVYLAGGSPSYTATGIAILSGYSKTFTGIWNLYTGESSSTYVNFRDSNYTGIGGTGYVKNGSLPFYTNDLMVTVSNRVYYDTNKSYALLSISGLDNNFYSTIISGGSL